MKKPFVFVAIVAVVAIVTAVVIIYDSSEDQSYEVQGFEFKGGVVTGDVFKYIQTATLPNQESVFEDTYVVERVDGETVTVSIARHNIDTGYSENLGTLSLPLYGFVYADRLGYDKVGTEMIETPYGNVRCDVYQNNDGENISTKIWYSPDLCVVLISETNHESLQFHTHTELSETSVVLVES